MFLEEEKKNVLKEKEKHQSKYKRKNKNYIRFFFRNHAKPRVE